MRLATLALVGALCALGVSAEAQTTNGVLIRCGASAGQSFFFKDSIFNPSGSAWEKDGMSNGKIVLIKLGEEWDIQFDDAAGAYGYRQDGAAVTPVMSNKALITVGAFHTNYVDLYTFDFENKVVGWSSTKIGLSGSAPKVGAYSATCQ